jgi:hypothetical protein
MDFACANRYLFFFIPTGSQCTLTQTSNAGSVQNYIEIACDPRFRGLGNGEGEVHGDLPTGR